MADASSRSSLIAASRGVRVRITAVATLVAGVAILIAGIWLVRAVEGSLNADLRTTEAADIAEVTKALEAGASPSDIDFRRLVSAGGATGQALQVIVGNRVVAATPNAVGLPPMNAVVGVAGQRQSVPVDIVGDMPVRRVLDGPVGEYSVSSGVVDADGARFTVIAASPLDPIRRTVDAVEDGLLVALPVLVIAVGLISWFLTGRALRPVESIRTEVESITGSTLSRRVPVPDSRDEVERLAHTMNAMLDRLESASVRQQQFVADASHELRSPVAAIRTELEVAQRSAGPDDWPDVVDHLLREEARLEATISDLLVLASLDESAPVPDATPVDLTGLVADEVERVRRRLGDGDPTVVLGGVGAVAGASAITVPGSAVQVARAVGNLVDNAVRHATTDVVVTVGLVGDVATVTVDDDGPGIPEVDRERVFERFTRLDAHRARQGDTGGAGLGLSLVRRILERHGGTVAVDDAPAGGARFVLTLPRSASRKGGC